jgi:hypothetical protein
MQLRIETGAKLFAIAILLSPAGHAQDRSIFIPNIGVEAGVPLTSMFSTYSIAPLDYPYRYTPYSYATPLYQVGLYADFHLTRHWGFEVDGLYRPGGIAFEQPLNSFYEHTHFNTWQFPMMFQYTFTQRHFRPFVDLGSSLRHISGVKTTFYDTAGYQNLGSANSSDILRNWSTWGGVAGVGIAFKEGPIEFRPQLRYTRWWNQAFGANGLSNSLNEGVFMLGIDF